MGFSLRGRRAGAPAQPPRPVEATEVSDNEATRVGVYLFAFALFAVGAGATTGVWMAVAGSVGALTAVVAVLVGLALAGAVRVAPQWERVAILRLGRFRRIAGPGPYVVVPLIDYAAMHVDTRVMNSSFAAEAALTADLVPVDVDAILFWMVWDAQKACLEVENYPRAVLRSAQTAMRDAIGQVNLADLSLRRKQIDRELQEVMGAKCEEWGITVMSVEIRDVKVPPELEDALSKEAQAERERNARTILAEVEKDISEMFVEAAEVYERKPVAMKLRAMNLAYEGAREGRGILLAPSGLADGFDLGKILED